MDSRPRRAAVALLMLSVGACGEPRADDPLAQGQRLFAGHGCVACHMSHGEGSPMGPPLRALANHWTREQLTRYFADPNAVAAHDERVAALKRRFPTPMAPVKADEAERLLLADYVLSL